MTKQDFLAELSERLKELPAQDSAEALAFWGEMIDDRMEDGTEEESAVGAIGTPAAIAAQILGEVPASKRIPALKEEKQGGRPWRTLLVIIGAPLWLPLLIAAIAVILSLYISVWAILISLWAAAISVTVCTLPLLALAVLSFIKTDAVGGLMGIGTAFISLGIGLCLLVLSLYLSKLLCRLTVRMLHRKIPQDKFKEERK